jgi:hypothetical protein
MTIASLNQLSPAVHTFKVNCHEQSNAYNPHRAINTAPDKKINFSFVSAKPSRFFG